MEAEAEAEEAEAETEAEAEAEKEEQGEIEAETGCATVWLPSSSSRRGEHVGASKKYQCNNASLCRRSQLWSKWAEQYAGVPRIQGTEAGPHAGAVSRTRARLRPSRAGQSMRRGRILQPTQKCRRQGHGAEDGGGGVTGRGGPRMSSNRRQLCTAMDILW